MQSNVLFILEKPTVVMC